MKVSSLPILLTLYLTIEFLLNFSLTTPARSESITRSAGFTKQIVFQDSFSPPDTDKPTDSSGAGSRSRAKFCQ